MPAVAARASARQIKSVQPRCEDCYFGRRGLCALNLGEPCSTFRAEGPRGIEPPQQTALIFAEPPTVSAAAA